MNQELDNIKKELALEIKTLASQISKTESFSGLLANEIHLRNLYEKLIVLKYLDKKRIPLADLELPIDQPLTTDIHNSDLQQNIYHSLVNDSKLKNTTQNYHPTQKEEVESAHIEKNTSIIPIKLDLNDKIAFRSQLFNGDSESIDLVIETLNRIGDLSSSLQYLSELKKEMEWGEKEEEYIYRLKDLILKRFNQ